MDEKWAKNGVQILNPLSSELSVLRQSMLFSGLEAAAYNINRKRQNLKLFEFGKTYNVEGKGYKESEHLSLLITGNRNSDSWTSANTKKSDFYYLKAVVVQILERLGIEGYSSDTVVPPIFSEGLLLKANKTLLVTLGIVDSSSLKKFEIKQEVLFADFNWAALAKLAGDKKIVYKKIPKFPAVKRDFALLINQEVTFNQVELIAYQTEKKLLKNISLFDVYTGDKLPEGKKSYAVSYTLQDESKTLTDKQIDKIMNKLKGAYEKQLGAELR